MGRSNGQAQPSGASEAATRPRQKLTIEASADGARVTARGLSPALAAKLGADLAARFRVTLAEGSGKSDVEPPKVSGECEILRDGARFTPHFPFEPGVRFRATLDMRGLGLPGAAEMATLEFAPPLPAASAPAEVSEIFPSGDALPENLLRFYVLFSKPMRRGRAEANVRVLDADGRPAPDVLYRPPVELWDSAMTRLTVLLDPGRLKRGVGPNRALGPPLRSGRRYTLAIAPGMADCDGQPLKRAFAKKIQVTDAVRAPLAPEAWKITPPVEGSLAPLGIDFPSPLDWAELRHGVRVAAGDGQPVSGTVEIGRGETRWRFWPDAPWRSGGYEVRVSPALEDVCGNTSCAAFDGPLQSPTPPSQSFLALRVDALPSASGSLAR